MLQVSDRDGRQEGDASCIWCSHDGLSFPHILHSQHAVVACSAKQHPCSQGHLVRLLESCVPGQDTSAVNMMVQNMHASRCCIVHCWFLVYRLLDCQ